MPTSSLDLLFLGSGNAFSPGGKAFSSFLLNGRYLFDCGPTLLQQLHKAGLASNDIEAVFISHFHADHFFGLPFLFLDGRYGGRSEDLAIIGPPGIESRTRRLMELGYPRVMENSGFAYRFIEVRDGFCGQVGGLAFSAASVEHVDNLDCYAFRVQADAKSLVYSGDTTLCEGLLRLARNADVVVLECSCDGVEVHLSPAQVAEVAKQVPSAKLIVTHLDGGEHPHGFQGLLVAEDLARFSF